VDIYAETLRRVACDCRLAAAGADGELMFTSPTGDGLRADAYDVEPSPDTNMPRWDGSTPDYDWAVGSVLAAG
jgi:hypothetical protein